MTDQDPIEGQDVKTLAQSLFSETNPDIERAIEHTPSDADNVIPIKSEEVKPVPAVVVPAQTPAIIEQEVQIDAEKMKQFEAWQQLQQAQSVVPVQQQQHQAAPVQQQQQQVPQLSKEEADRVLNKFTLTQKEYDAIFKTESEEASIEALNEVLQNTVKQAVTMAFHLVQDTEQRVVSGVKPYMQFADSQREIMLRETFFAEHPTLRGADPILNAVMTQMATGGQKFNTQKDLFDAVAKSTKAQLAQMGMVQGQANTKPAGNGQKPRMAALPTGGQGGSSQSAATGQSGGSNTARAIFA
jgi:hypothetical protein